MVSQTSLLALLLTATVAFAQKDGRPEIIRKGLFRAQATITPAVMLNTGELNIYIHGDAEFHLQRRVSLRGDGYYFIDTQGDGMLRHNHSVFFGPQYHFPIGRFAPYIGMQPGVGYVQAVQAAYIDAETGPQESGGAFIPLISATTGFNFYLGRFVHFLGMVRYVHGKHAAPWGNVQLDEFRFSLGLGWNVNTIKAKKR
jgi:hypothetical protein